MDTQFYITQPTMTKVVKRVLKEYTEANEQKAFEMLEEHGIKGLSYFKLLGLDSKEEIKAILEHAEQRGIVDLPMELIENTWLPPGNDRGWGNGYVFLDSTHPFYGRPYEEIEVVAPGGITYSEWSDNVGGISSGLEKGKWWVLGFDTAHSYNNSSHNKQWVYEATLDLLIDLYTTLN